MYVLLTTSKSYFVEYLLGELVLSNSINDAMVFDEEFIAQRFKKMLYETCKLETSVNTFISPY